MEDFNYELAMQLSNMFRRAEDDKKFISRILDAKNQILNEDEVFPEDIHMINRLLDDIIKLQEIFKIHREAFAKFLFVNANMDYLLEEKVDYGRL